ncbi:hypothetical protein EDM53_01970 [Rickettsiales endosymbiont of Peranema trichophorum]|uniref:ribosome-binding factor A n=1 Tax=Rickettsiales endosymbiont of Peranema trichophorum TaxID=2486577 RepID=UPI001022F811|nr:ribosome-binding factor A [Rickettsiales endosymbiont of Peranema trichophorum]RZI47422.1 hypothetical protein EDM53_01970 [Rickettsiales endosymbiont of Peranema trichophorum]
MKTKQQKSIRHLRVARALKAAVCEILSNAEYYEPVLESSFFTVSRVEVTPDLKRAIIFITGEPTTQQGVVECLRRVSPKIRTLAAHKLSLRYVPEFLFSVDNKAHTKFQIKSGEWI